MKLKLWGLLFLAILTNSGLLNGSNTCAAKLPMASQLRLLAAASEYCSTHKKPITKAQPSNEHAGLDLFHEDGSKCDDKNLNRKYAQIH